MLDIFLTILEQMFRILLFLTVGFCLNRFHILPKEAGTAISRLVTTILLPSLLIYNYMTEFNLAHVQTYGQIVITGMVLWLIITLLSLPAVKALAKGNPLDRGVYLYGLSFPNSSAVGTPVVLGLLGTAGLFQFNMFTLAASIMTYAWGIGLFLPTKQKNPMKKILSDLFNPVCVAVLIGLVLGMVNAKTWMPAMVTEVLGDISGCYVPISLIQVGFTVANYPFKQVFNRPRSYVFTLLRLIVIPLLTIAAAWFIKADLTLVTLIVLFFACPSGMNVVVFPSAYGQDCRTGASIVLLSSLGSLITIPLIYTLAQMIF